MGLLQQAHFLNHPERVFYDRLLEVDTAFFVGVADQLRQIIDQIKPDIIFCDAVEFYNPVHDVTLPIVRAALRDCADKPPVYEIPLVYQRHRGDGNEISYVCQENGDKHGLSSRPLLALFASQVFETTPDACHEKADGPAARAVAEAVRQAWEESSPINSQDVEVWFFPENGLVYPVDLPALSLIYQEIGERRDSPCPVLQGRQLDRLLERAEAINGAVQPMSKAPLNENP
jgi:hypothetical protein